MKFKCLKTMSICLMLFFTVLLNVANASLILNNITDNNEYTTVNGIDWLDWTTTMGLSQTEALDSYDDWRIATAEEMSEMLEVLFEQKLVYTLDGYTNGTAQFTDWSRLRTRFTNLFGLTSVHRDTASLAIIEGYGLSGVDGAVYNGLDRPFGDVGYSSVLYGVAIVRNTSEVPEPSTLVIFALGMIGLASRKFKKKS